MLVHVLHSINRTCNILAPQNTENTENLHPICKMVMMIYYTRDIHTQCVPTPNMNFPSLNFRIFIYV